MPVRGWVVVGWHGVSLGATAHDAGSFAGGAGRDSSKTSGLSRLTGQLHLSVLRSSYDTEQSNQTNIKILVVS